MPQTSYIYNDISQYFSSKNCKLLTTNDDYDELIKTKKNSSEVSLKYIASCGHENNIVYASFKYRNLGFKCTNCKNIKTSNEYKEKNINYIKQETDFTREFQLFLEDEFDSILTNEGCQSDLIIKPKNIEEDKWLLIQIKTTHGISIKAKSYGFHLSSKGYTDHILICHSISDEKYWLIPYNNIEQPIEENSKKKQTKISIGQDGGKKYSVYYTENQDIKKKLLSYYNSSILYSKEGSIVSTSSFGQKEQVYRKKIYEYLSFLTIEEPEYTNMVYDLIINKNKIQEKVIHHNEEKKYYTSLLFKRNGRNDVQNYNCYDNDFYWLHVPDTDYFFVIPQHELYYRNIISLIKTPGKKSLSIHLNYNENYIHNWVQKYLFDYTNINQEKLLKILSDDYEDIMCNLIYNEITNIL